MTVSFSKLEFQCAKDQVDLRTVHTGKTVGFSLVHYLAVKTVCGTFLQESGNRHPKLPGVVTRLLSRSQDSDKERIISNLAYN